MIRQLLVELTRLRWRRAVVLLLAAAAVVPLLILLQVVLTTSAPQSDALERAQQSADADLARCVDDPSEYGVPDDADPAQTCREYGYGEPANYVDYDALDLDRERESGSGTAIAALLGVAMFLVGTTFAGHDWATGSMSNQLLFQPRRLRVWTAKLGAVVLAALVVAGVVTTAYWLLMAAAYGRSGVDPRPGAVLDCLQHGWRSAGFAAAAAAGGYAVTMLVRSTVFTLGLLFGISVAGGILISLVVDDPGPWDPTINAAAVISDGTTYYVDVPDSCYSGEVFQDTGECDSERERSLGQGIGYFAILLGAVGAASAGSFARRDVG